MRDFNMFVVIKKSMLNGPENPPKHSCEADLIFISH